MNTSSTPEQIEQIPATIAIVRAILKDALLAVYLHGSAASSRLQQQSDIDLLAVVERALTEEQRDLLLAALLRFSGRHPAPPNGPRCLEVMVFSRHDLCDSRYPARAEFVYGEWLRGAFEAGEKPLPTRAAEHTLVLAQAYHEAIALLGPDRESVLTDVPFADVRQAMRDLLPGLLAGLHGDERNVLLTLARMWRTATTREFVSKDAAARWAMPRLCEEGALLLDYARRAYLGDVVDEWGNRHDAARKLAERLGQHVTTAFSV